MELCAEILIIEIFSGGSHKGLVETISEGLEKRVPGRVLTITYPAKKWHWRARTGALSIFQDIPERHNFRVLFTSSVLNLAELIALRPDLIGVRKIVYNHENQLIYPVREVKQRDFQYGYNQILTCLVADKIVFNSEYNMTSFLQNINKFFKVQPDMRPKNLKEKILPKCIVIYYPIHYPLIQQRCVNTGILHIVWPHRWEHDKNPELFFEILFSLFDSGHNFKLSVLGEQFTTVPEIFNKAKEKLSRCICHWGFSESKEEYFSILNSSDVVISTAKHEFFGVAMLEAVYSGCYPLAPNDLVYPEIFPVECLYNNKKELFKKLSEFCKNPGIVFWMKANLNFDIKKYSVERLLPKFLTLFDEDEKLTEDEFSRRNNEPNNLWMNLDKKNIN